MGSTIWTSDIRSRRPPIDLSQLMRHLFGIGTSKQAAAKALHGLIELLFASLRWPSAIFAPFQAPRFFFAGCLLNLFAWFLHIAAAPKTGLLQQAASLMR